MKIEYICERQYPNDIEKQAIKKVLIENMAILRDGDGLILPHKKVVIFLAKHGETIKILDYIISGGVIEIKE